MWSVKTFRYKGRRWKFFAGYSVLVLTCAGILVYATSRHQLSLTIFAVFFGSLCWLALIGWIYAISSAEVLVDDVGISRRLFERICQHIKWNDVKCVRESRVTNSRVSVTAIRIISKSHKFWNFDVTKTMTISERFEGFERLVDILNEHVEVNGIRVEVQSNGIWERRSRISYKL